MNSEKKLCERCSRAWIAERSDEPCPFCRATSLENAVDALLPRLNIITALRRHNQPHRPDAVDAVYERQLDLEALMEDKARFSRPEFQIGAVYFPEKGEVDFLFQSDSGNLTITQRVAPDLGRFVARMFYPGVYMTAAMRLQGEPALRRLRSDMRRWLEDHAADDIERRNQVQEWLHVVHCVLKGRAV